MTAQDLDSALEDAILNLLHARAPGTTICPSEAAKQVAAASRAHPEWRELMEPARAAASRLVASGRIVVTQRCRIIEPEAARGPIRLKLRA